MTLPHGLYYTDFTTQTYYTDFATQTLARLLETCTKYFKKKNLQTNPARERAEATLAVLSQNNLEIAATWQRAKASHRAAAGS